MEDQKSQMGSGWKGSQHNYGLNRQGEKVNPWAPGVTWKKLVSWGPVWQEWKPWRRLDRRCRHQLRQSGLERGDWLCSPTCFSIHQGLLLAELALSLEGRCRADRGQAMDLRASKPKLADSQTYLLPCLMKATRMTAPPPCRGSRVAAVSSPHSNTHNPAVHARKTPSPVFLN